jgi:hypothetical protein
MRNDKKQMKPKDIKQRVCNNFIVYGTSWFEWEAKAASRYDGYSLFTREAERQAVIDSFYEAPFYEHGASIDKTFEMDDEKLFRKVKKMDGRYSTEELA